MNHATLCAPLRFEGVGLHTGVDARVEVRPSEPGNGLVFVLETPAGTSVRVPATAEYVIDTSLATVIGRDGASVSTVEHLLSALLGMGVSDADIVVWGPEIPIVDGSATYFTQEIAAIGLDVRSSERDELRLDYPYELRDGDRAVIVLPAEEFRVRFVADFAPPIGTQYLATSIEPQRYREEIAPARTFGYLRDVERMRARGLARGGNLENALVFDTNGPLQELRWTDEVVRHKILDLVGDFALLGLWPRCEIIAVKSGHWMHARVTRELRARLGLVSTAKTA